MGAVDEERSKLRPACREPVPKHCNTHYPSLGEGPDGCSSVLQQRFPFLDVGLPLGRAPRRSLPDLLHQRQLPLHHHVDRGAAFRDINLLDSYQVLHSHWFEMHACRFSVTQDCSDRRRSQRPLYYILPCHRILKHLISELAEVVGWSKGWSVT